MNRQNQSAKKKKKVYFNKEVLPYASAFPQNYY